MKSLYSKLGILLLITLLFYTPTMQAGEPVCHILICCRNNNRGMTFLVDGKWNPLHDYGDINQVKSVLQNIKDAGIKTVIVDMTNAAQWVNYWDEYKPMVDNIQKVCEEKNMQFFLFIGVALPKDIRAQTGIEGSDFMFWNKMAKKIWDTWAKDSKTYKRYGYGDDRPILIAFQPSETFWEKFNEAPKDETNYLAKFHIGNTQVNDPILPGKSDGWGYRNYSQSVDGNVRFVSPNMGVPPQDWKRISKEEWGKRIEWAKEASEYSIYGSYDDTCDAIHWGIANTEKTQLDFLKYPDNDPYYYYSVLQNALLSKDNQGTSK